MGVFKLLSVNNNAMSMNTFAKLVIPTLIANNIGLTEFYKTQVGRANNIYYAENGSTL